MDFSKLTENKPLLFGIIGGVVLLIAILVFVGIGSRGTEGVVKEKKIKEPMELLLTDNIGKALEIQSMLAKEGINVTRKPDGKKSYLILKDYTPSERDRALLTIVRSGIMDKNMGLEIFDKGDFTSSKEDKRIRLARAINGEISRLIRKIPPIEDAAVFVSIPEQTIFTSMKKPITATVQVTMPVGNKLDRDKVRAISNLLVGSVTGLIADNISITDTNGNVYNSVTKSEDDMMALLEDNDQYIKSKVQTQLEKLVGKGNFVVTVSTFLRQSPQEVSKITYDPKESAVASSQKFVESLGDKSADKNKINPTVSSYIPSSLPQSPESNASRNYTRSATELSYGVGKTQTSEIKTPGVIEEISIAVTINKGTLPEGMEVEQFKSWIAKSASPKVSAENVEVAFANIPNPMLASEKPIQFPQPEDSGNPWWTIAVILGSGLVIGLIVIAKNAKSTAAKQQKEINNLLDKSEQQQNLIREAQDRASKLLTQQEQMNRALTLQNAPKEEENLSVGETQAHEFNVKLKSWIESTSGE